MAPMLPVSDGSNVSSGALLWCVQWQVVRPMASYLRWSIVSSGMICPVPSMPGSKAFPVFECSPVCVRWSGAFSVVRWLCI